MKPLLIATLWLGCVSATAAETGTQVPADPDAEARPMIRDAEDTATPPARLSQIVVTGSRIKRIDIETALPITTIERIDLLRSGEFSISDAIRDLASNSFGSFADRPLLSIPNVSLPGLRGLNSKYTLVLLDGQRLPGVASVNGGAAASLTGIPLSAIDRVEVLRDGASAIYGSDAVGGVINLLTRRDDIAPQFELQLEQPQDDGGEAWRASFITGRGHERGSWMLTLETQDREPLYGAQRDYLLQNATLIDTGDPGTFIRFDPETEEYVGDYEADARCPDALDTDPVFPHSVRTANPFDGGFFCGYRFRALNMERAGYEGRSLFASGRFDLNERTSVFARVQAIHGDSLSQAAPTPLGGVIIEADNPFNPTRGEYGPDLGYPLEFFYRLSALGPRIMQIQEETLHALIGLNGTLDWGQGGDYSVSLHHNRYDHDAFGRDGFARRAQVLEAIASGRFNPFAALPNDATGLEDVHVFPFINGASRATALEAAFSIDAAFLGGLDASYAFGVDLRRDEYRLDADADTLNGNVIGLGADPQQGATRDYAAIYGELLLPLGERWETSLAARYDRYEDAGAAFSPKLSVGFRPDERWLLRASLASGFQAPTLTDAYGPGFEGGAFTVDQVACATRPENPNACRRRFIYVFNDTNPNLDTESATQGSFGVVWQPHEDFNLSFDYYRIRVRDQIGSLRVEDALLRELECLQTGRSCELYRDGEVVRNALGNIDAVVLPLINIAGTWTAGVDLEAAIRRATGIGDFELQLRASRVLNFDVQASPEQPRYELLGAYPQPDFRGSARLDWQRGRHGLSLGAEYIGDFGNCFAQQLADGSPDPFCRFRIPSHTEFDAQWRWQTPWKSELALGGRNLGNRPPSLSPFGQVPYGLYDVNGRVWYLRYQHAF